MGGNTRNSIPGGGKFNKRTPDKHGTGRPYPPSGHIDTSTKFPDGGGPSTSVAAIGGSSSARKKKATEESPVLDAMALKRIKADLKPTGESTPATSSPNTSIMSVGDTGTEEVNADVPEIPDVPFATATVMVSGIGTGSMLSYL